MNRKLITIISVCVASVISVAGGAVAGVKLYRGADKRAVQKAFALLSEDMTARAEETITVKEAADLYDAVMYGDAHIDASVNVGGIDVSGLIPDEVVSGVLSGVLGNLSDITIGVDTEIDRKCSDEELSVLGSLSVMNYTLADVEIYARGDKAYLNLPKFSDVIYEIDMSDIGSTVDDSDMLSYAWGQSGLPRLRSVELFGGPPQADRVRMIGDISESPERTDAVRDMWKNAEADRREETGIIEINDENETECRIYDVTIPQADAQMCVDKLFTIGADVEFTVYIDEYKDIRCMETRSPLYINGSGYDIRIELTDAEVPIDEMDIALTTYDADNSSETNTLNTHISRDGRDFGLLISSGDSTAQGVLTPKYDRSSAALDLDFSKVSFVYRDEEILRSSGRIAISSAEDAVEVKPVPGRTTIDSFEEFAFDVVRHVLDMYGALIGLDPR